ncbi:hypothetical protein BC826DRAFT_87382 [Russula brevipes]|nr:hypothetical protein BC826DRAFT_87382 [Russula brevipes]
MQEHDTEGAQRDGPGVPDAQTLQLWWPGSYVVYDGLVDACDARISDDIQSPKAMLAQISSVALTGLFLLQRSQLVDRGDVVTQTRCFATFGTRMPFIGVSRLISIPMKIEYIQEGVTRELVDYRLAYTAAVSSHRRRLHKGHISWGGMGKCT